ncbi:MAG: permease [Burkholderiales bacterium PBB5]|nr:MAG: permease [Burkholderiales bacterium PBB5]
MGMVGRLQRWVVAGVLLMLVLVWAWSAVSGWSLLARCAVLAGVTMPHAPVLALEMGLMCGVRWRQGLPLPSMASCLWAWAHEVVSGWRVFGWRQPFAEFQVADGAGVPGRTGVVLVHGYVCNRALWTPWLKALRARQVPCSARSHGPVFGSIDSWVSDIDAAVRAMTQATGRPPLVVAHSMGGLAVRAWLQAAGATPEVARVVTVAPPPRGTWLAQLGLSANARQMREGSAWLQALALRESAAQRVCFHCVYSDCDNVVFPAEVACLPGATHQLVPGYAHVHLLSAPVVLATVLDLLAEADRRYQVASCPGL